MSKCYLVLIQNSPTAEYQPYRGWDTVYTDRRTAVATRDEAKRKFCAAKLVSATRDEAERLGWFNAPQA